MRQDSEPDLLSLVHDVARLIRIAADKRARVDGMTRAQWGLLVRIWRNPGVSQKEVADLLEVEPISVARLVDRLERSGLIERRPEPADRRIWRLHLCPAAAPVLQRIMVQKAELAAMIEDGLKPALRDAMLAGLTRMKANLVQQNLSNESGSDASETTSFREIA
jgi:MarR family transcriptional regulator for hemolysin